MRSLKPQGTSREKIRYRDKCEIRVARPLLILIALRHTMRPAHHCRSSLKTYLYRTQHQAFSSRAKNASSLSIRASSSSPAPSGKGCSESRGRSLFTSSSPFSPSSDELARSISSSEAAPQLISKDNLGEYYEESWIPEPETEVGDLPTPRQPSQIEARADTDTYTKHTENNIGRISAHRLSLHA